MVRVYAAADLQEAHLVRGLLQQAGIEAQIFNEHARGAMGDIPASEAYPEVWVVDERDEQRARSLIADYETASISKPARRCSACGEESPGNFGSCWNCGASF